MIKLLGLAPLAGLLPAAKLLDGDPDRICDSDGGFRNDNPSFHFVEAFDRRTGGVVCRPDKLPGRQWYIESLNVKEKRMRVFADMEKDGRIRVLNDNGAAMLRNVDFPIGIRLLKREPNHG